MQQRLATRLVLSHFLVVALGLGVAGAGLLSQSRRYFVDAERKSLLVQARVAASSCGEPCLTVRKAKSIVNNNQLPPAANVKQSQINAPGNLVIDNDLTNQISAALPNNVRVYRQSDALRSTIVAKAFNGLEITNQTNDVLTAAAPIRRDGTVVGAIEVTGSLADVNSVLNDLRHQVLVAIGVGSLAALLFGLWRARSISRPLRELTIASRAIADGDFTQPLPTAKGRDELAELTTTFGDMRDRVQSELAIRNAFVADASHELRSPLTAIRGAVEILQSGGSERPDVRERFLGSLGRETDRLLGLVNNLLELQTSEHASYDALRLDELASDVVKDYQDSDRPVRLGEHEACVAHGDADRLRQILVNLIDNALTHSLADDPIIVCVHTVEDRCHVEVEDHGPGIPVADRERVFDRFVRLDQSRNRSRGGAGLGLSIARTIAIAHKGTLTLHERPGGGTIARLDLPIHQPNG
jgi:signal transduction histidine kinase